MCMPVPEQRDFKFVADHSLDLCNTCSLRAATRWPQPPHRNAVFADDQRNDVERSCSSESIGCARRRVSPLTMNQEMPVRSNASENPRATAQLTESEQRR